MSRETSKASPRRQLRAGGVDRLANDEGGHYIARRFNGPSADINLFAQDRNFNRGRYRQFEAQLARQQASGKSVYVRIIPSYRGTSQRPYKIDYWYRIDGKWRNEPFTNDAQGNRDDRAR